MSSDLCKDCKTNIIDFSRSKIRCSSCLEIYNARQLKYYYEHKEKALESQREYVKRNKDKRRVYDTQYHEKNKAKIRARCDEWNNKNKERMLQYRKEYREENREKIRSGKQKCWYARHEHYLQKSKDWRKNNLERSNELLKVSAHKRRANIKGNGGSFTPEEWDALKVKYNNQCICCGREDVKLEVDHVIPISEGGTSNIDNIQPLCRSCNARKHKKNIDYRIQYDVVQDWT